MEYSIANFANSDGKAGQNKIYLFCPYISISQMEYFIANFCKFKIGRLAKISFDYFSHIL